MQKFCEKFVNEAKKRLSDDKTYEKSLVAFTKSLENVVNGKKPIFEQALYSFSKDLGGKKGGKRKTG